MMEQMKRRGRDAPQFGQKRRAEDQVMLCPHHDIYDTGECCGRCPDCGVPIDEIPFDKCATHRAHFETEDAAPEAMANVGAYEDWFVEDEPTNH